MARFSISTSCKSSLGVNCEPSFQHIIYRSITELILFELLLASGSISLMRRVHGFAVSRLGVVRFWMAGPMGVVGLQGGCVQHGGCRSLAAMLVIGAAISAII